MSAIEAVAGVDVGLFEALLQRVDVCAQMAIVVLETIGVASCGGAAGDAVGGLALGVRVDAGAAASGLGVALDLADLAGTIPYEVLCAISARVPRVTIGGDARA